MKNLHGVRLKFHSIIFIILFLNPPECLFQLESKLPDNIVIIENGLEKVIGKNWHAELTSLIDRADYKYQIVAVRKADNAVVTKIKVPQFLSIEELQKQVILYYSLVEEERIRETETVFIYPYFVSEADTPAIICSFKSPGRYNFSVSQWQQIPFPNEPTLDEKEIFNQILNLGFAETQLFSEISDNIFKTVAQKNKTEVSVIKKIYKKVMLWQLSN